MRLSRAILPAIMSVFLAQPAPWQAMAADAPTEEDTSKPVGSPRDAYTAEQQTYMGELDALLADEKYGELAAKMLKPGSAAQLSAALDWGRDRMLQGSSIAVPAIQANLLWRVGSARPEYEDLKHTSALVLSYTFIAAISDGLKCSDSTAATQSLQALIDQNGPLIKAISNFSDDEKNQIFDQAVIMEAKIGPLRKNDDFLCRFGVDQYAADTKQKDEETAGSKPDAVDEKAKFLRPVQWDLAQIEARKGFRQTLVNLFTARPAPDAKP